MQNTNQNIELLWKRWWEQLSVMDTWESNHSTALVYRILPSSKLRLSSIKVTDISVNRGFERSAHPLIEPTEAKYYSGCVRLPEQNRETCGAMKTENDTTKTDSQNHWDWKHSLSNRQSHGQWQTAIQSDANISAIRLQTGKRLKSQSNSEITHEAAHKVRPTKSASEN